MLCCARTTYNMMATACCLEHISDMLDLKTNEWLHEARWLLHVALKEQATSLTSRRCAALSRSSKLMATINGDRSDTRTPPIGGDSGDTFSNSSNHPRTRGTKP
jgi:hypothetical protein